jgi:hypothetical protein
MWTNPTPVENMWNSHFAGIFYGILPTTVEIFFVQMAMFHVERWLVVTLKEQDGQMFHVEHY